jgi:hypothetical protein
VFFLLLCACPLCLLFAVSAVIFDFCDLLFALCCILSAVYGLPLTVLNSTLVTLDLLATLQKSGAFTDIHVKKLI